MKLLHFSRLNLLYSMIFIFQFKDIWFWRDCLILYEYIKLANISTNDRIKNQQQKDELADLWSVTSLNVSTCCAWIQRNMKYKLIDFNKINKFGDTNKHILSFTNNHPLIGYHSKNSTDVYSVTLKEIYCNKDTFLNSLF